MKQFWAIIITTFLLSLGMGIISPILSPFAKFLGASGLWIGLVFSGMNLVRVFLGPIIGRIYDRTLKTRGLLLIGVVFYTISAIIFVYSKWYQLLFGARLVQGIGLSFILPVAGTTIAMLAPEGRVSTFIGGYSTAFFLAFGLGPTIGGWLADNYGVRVTFLTLILLGILAFITVSGFVSDAESKKKRTERNPVTFIEALRNPTVLALMLYRIVFAMARSTVFSFFPILGIMRGLNNTQIGLVVSLQMLLMSFLQFPAGWFADKVKRKFLILYGTLIATAVTLIVLPFLNTFEGFMILSIFFALASALSAPTALGMAAVEGAKNESTGTILSMNQSAFGIGMIFGPIISGFVFDFFGIKWVFFGGSVYVVVGMILLILLRSATKGIVRLGGIPVPPDFDRLR